MQIPPLMFAEGGWCEALRASYRPGVHHPKTREEYLALAPFAVDPEELEPEEAPKVPAPMAGSEAPAASIPASATKDKPALCAWAKENVGLDLDPESGTKAVLLDQVKAALAAKG